MKKVLLLVVIMGSMAATVSFSQSNQRVNHAILTHNLKGVHSIVVQTGFKMNSSSSVIASSSHVNAETNFIGSVGYQYWFDNEWAIYASAGIFRAETSVNHRDISSISIVPVQFGFSYYPQSLTIGDIGRFHLGANVGAYIGSASGVQLDLKNFRTGTVNETVFGIEPNTGIDFFISKRFRISPKLSYHFVDDFKEFNGRRKNYSGAVFSVNFGLML